MGPFDKVAIVTGARSRQVRLGPPFRHPRRGLGTGKDSQEGPSELVQKVEGGARLALTGKGTHWVGSLTVHFYLLAFLLGHFPVGVSGVEGRAGCI